MSDLLDVGGILEVSAQYKDDLGTLLYGPDDMEMESIEHAGHDPEDVVSVREALENSAFAGRDVRHVSMPSIHDEPPTKVPHFGFGAANNERVNGDLKPLRDEPVLRMFNCDLILDAAETGSSMDVMGTYKVMPGVRLTISRTGILRAPDEGDRTDRPEIEDAAPLGDDEQEPAEWWQDRDAPVDL